MKINKFKQEIKNLMNLGYRTLISQNSKDIERFGVQIKLLQKMLKDAPFEEKQQLNFNCPECNKPLKKNISLTTKKIYWFCECYDHSFDTIELIKIINRKRIKMIDSRIVYTECSSKKLRKDGDSYLCLDCLNYFVVMICLNCNSIIEKALVNKDGNFCDTDCLFEYYNLPILSTLAKKVILILGEDIEEFDEPSRYSSVDIKIKLNNYNKKYKLSIRSNPTTSTLNYLVKKELVEFVRDGRKKYFILNERGRQWFFALKEVKAKVLKRSIR